MGRRRCAPGAAPRQRIGGTAVAATGGRAGPRAAGTRAWGYAEDQCGTLGRVKRLIGPLFHIGYTVEGVGKLLHRHGWSVQVPVRRRSNATKRPSPPGKTRCGQR
ncbi:winged helix-turn-helix domain-containing protein [Nonomuraea sp. NPDC046570]|uniref:helix-turn-helix domain-containing protein n=1 Tax=Nonomuraea sp. NPDC046570 TaxID=3155255 RepID=UPI0033FD2955